MGLTRRGFIGALAVLAAAPAVAFNAKNEFDLQDALVHPERYPDHFRPLEPGMLSSYEDDMWFEQDPVPSVKHWSAKLARDAKAESHLMKFAGTGADSFIRIRR